MVGYFPGSADYAPAGACATFTISPATPTFTVNDPDWNSSGPYIPTTASVSGVDNVAAGNLEGMTPIVTYLDSNGNVVAVPTSLGNYTAVAFFPGSADYAPATSQPYSFTITDYRTVPTLGVTDNSGAFTGSPFAAAVTVAGADNIAHGSLEGVSPALAYYGANGQELTAAPTHAGSYTVVASFPGSADYAPAGASVSFTINLAHLNITVSDAGGTYNGSAFPATATLAGVNGSSVASLEGVSPALTYYDSQGNPLNGAPTDVGNYFVRAFFPGSIDYTSAVTPEAAYFTISQPQERLRLTRWSRPSAPTAFTTGCLSPRRPP